MLRAESVFTRIYTKATDGFRANQGYPQALLTILLRYILYITYIYLYFEEHGKIRHKKSPGRPRKLNERMIRRIVNAVSNKTIGVRKIQRDVVPDISHMTVYRALNSTPNIICQRMQKFPMITKAHKCARLAFAEKHIRNPGIWNQVFILKLFPLSRSLIGYIFR